MRVALVNPDWTFGRSIYFGCHERHLPLEFGCARALLERAGHSVELVDAHAEGLDEAAVADRVAAFRPEMTVVTTAPTYLFWRCPPPELRVPQATVAALREVGGLLVAVGPHGSTTPEPVLAKLGVDVLVMGECEETLVALANRAPAIEGICFKRDGRIERRGGPQATNFAELPALRWTDAEIARHGHHHHRFDTEPAAPGAEVEASRGCPYHCSFCAKENFRDAYRRRPVATVMDEIAALQRQGVEYVYFIDEIFLPNRPLLRALVGRGLKFGVQTRLDLWKPDTIELLGQAGCVSIEAGVESLSAAGRDWLAKDCRIDTEALTGLLIEAKRHVPFVQANLILTPEDDSDEIAAWRARVRAHGIWANDPVPLFPYPGTPDYRRLWGHPDDQAWERAVNHYRAHFGRFSDIQDEAPAPLAELERPVP